jgi:hypothetical protein
MHHDRLITVRKLAALDLIFHGRKLVLVEFGVGVSFSTLLGFWFIYSGLSADPDPSYWIALLGVGLLGIGLNYVPLLIYALQLQRPENARKIVLYELGHPQTYQRMYGLQSVILIIVPFALLVLAAFQVIRGK